MLEGVVAIDNEERIININDAAAGFFDCNPEECPGRNLQEIIQICRSKAQEKKIDINHICEAQLTSWFDSSLLEQAVVNLLDNAIKYSEPNSIIHLKANLKDSEVKIIVEDRGIGIAKKHLPRLFERFYRVDKARSRNLGGTGLGLAIVKHIAQAHGGKVPVESTLGEGSVFTIHLPEK